ncbi:MAG TPA: sulfite exporter TauE/SafE family protein [Nevskiaceae bacterium]|nr:sulfite exporter TauE/SafE family protein [Nevskiaceae bacterium]
MFLLQGFLTGLSVGVYCIGVCLPVVIPILLSQRRRLKSAFWVILEFSLGRLLGYILFGLVISWLGATISTSLIHWFVSIGTVLIAFLMIGYTLGFWVWGARVCVARFKKVKIPFLLGFLTGINVCPPFLASVGYLFSLGNILAGVGYFLAFFLGTSVYIVPLGFLYVLTTNKVFRKVALISGFLAGFYFLFFAVRNILRLI